MSTVATPYSARTLRLTSVGQATVRDFEILARFEEKHGDLDRP